MLGSIALIALLYIYGQMVQHWSWYLFDHLLLRMPEKSGRNAKWLQKLKKEIYIGTVVIGLLIHKLTIYYPSKNSRCQAKVFIGKIFAGILIVGLSVAPILLIAIIKIWNSNLIMLSVLVVIFLFWISIELFCIKSLKNRFSFDFFHLKKKIRNDLGSNTRKLKIQQWQVLELVLKYNPDSGKNMIKEFARSSLAKMLAFNSMLIVIILMVRKVIDPLWCINHTIIGKIFDFNDWEKYCCVVLMFIVLMLMFLREYYLRNGRNNEHLCEAYMAISSDVRKANA